MAILGSSGRIFIGTNDIQVYGIQRWELNLNAETIDPTTVDKWFSEPEKGRISGSGSFEFQLNLLDDPTVKGGDYMLDFMLQLRAGARAACDFWMTKDQQGYCLENGLRSRAGGLYYTASIMVVRSSVNTRPTDYVAGVCEFVTYGQVLLLNERGVPPLSLPFPGGGAPSIGTVTVAPSPLTVTAGQTATLTASYSGNATDATYSWSRPPGSAAPISTTNVLQWNATTADSGTYTVTVSSATSADSPRSGSATVTVNAAVTDIGVVTVSPSVSTTSAGSLVTLTASNTGGPTGVSWTWSRPAGSSAPVSTTNVLSWTGLDTDDGVYTAIATKAGASDSPRSGTSNVTVNALPTIGTITVTPNPVDVSFGTPVTLTAVRSGNASDITWNWTKPVGSSAPSSNTSTLAWTTAPGDSGTYTATATSASSSDSPKSGTAAVTVAAATIGTLSIATSHPGTIHVGDVVTLTASYTGNATGVTYAWTKPPASTAPSSTTNILTWTVADVDDGNYVVTATSASAADSPKTANITINVLPVVDIVVANIVYSQSAVYAGNTAATLATMTNGNASETTSTGTNSPGWVRMDFGAVARVGTIVVGADYFNTLAGGWGPSYAANSNLEASDDGNTWTFIRNIGSFTVPIKEMAVSLNARYIRVVSTSWVAITELYALSPGTARIGTLSVTPNPSSTIAGAPVTLTASISGNATDVVWSWTKPVGSTAPVSTTNVLSWNGVVGDTGAYSVTATSATSFDSPRTVNVSVSVSPPGTGVPAVWVTGVSGITYSNANRTATANNDAEKSVKTTLSKSSGKWYTEIAALLQGNTQASADTLFGLVVSSSTVIPGFAGSGGVAIASGRTATSFNDLASATFAPGGLSYANGSRVFRVAVDHDNKRMWLGVDANWLGGGDPATGTSPTAFNWTGTRDWVATGRPIYNTTVLTLPTTVGGLTYPLPAGFSLWDS